MKYVVIKKFKDLLDSNHLYQLGDAYPRSGKKATQKRIAELSGSKNKAGQPLIEAVPEECPEVKEEPEKVEKPKKTTKKKGK